MDKKKLEDKAEELFPLPKKEDYKEAGEAFWIETGIIRQRQLDYIAGGVYVLENIIPVK